MPSDHPAVIDFEMALITRNLERGQLARRFSNREVTRCRAKVRTLTNIRQAEYVLSNPEGAEEKARRTKTIRCRGGC